MEKSVYQIDSSGKIIFQFDMFAKNTFITSIAVDKSDLYAADAQNRIIWKINRSTREIKKIGAQNPDKEIPGFIISSYHFDLALDPDGFLWVVNPGRHQLENYLSNGNFRTSWGKTSMSIEGFCGCCNPTDITIMDNGYFVTSEKGIPRVKIYDQIGDLFAVVAGPEKFEKGTIGLDLAVDSRQRIYILDPKKKQIRIFRKKEV